MWKMYLLMIHHTLSKVASLVNKGIIVIGVIMAITGFFLHYNLQDIPRQQDKTVKIRQNIYTTITQLKKKKTPKNDLAIKLFRFSTCITMGEACTDNPNDGDRNYSTSLFGYVGTLITMPYANPPASGIAWLQDGLQNAGFVPNTYAAGVGFYSLSAFADVWKIFRNITFFLMALAIVVVGFLIMFRVKIDSQTVISLENSLPRIIITLILITFSFAIAGFLVDLMYVLIIICINILGNTDLTHVNSVTPDKLQSLYLTNQVPLSEAFWGQNYGQTYVEGVRGLIEFIPGAIKALLIPIIYIFSYLTLSGFLLRFQDTFNLDITGSVVVASIKGNVGAILFFIVVNIILLILIPILIWWGIPWLLALIILLFLFFRILFMLIGAYVQIVINVIFAPVMILPNVIPGNNAFMEWLKRLIGNMLVFPITIVLLIVVQLIGVNDEFIGNRFIGDAASQNLAPSQLSFPMLSMQTSQLVPIITAAFLLLIPTLVRKVTEKIAGPSIIEAGPGTLFAGAGGAVGTVVSQYAGLATFARTMQGSALGNAFGWIPGIRGAKGPTPLAEPPRVSTNASPGSAIDSAQENTP